MKKILGFLLFMLVFMAENHAAEGKSLSDSERQERLKRERQQEDAEYEEQSKYVKQITRENWKDISNGTDFTCSRDDKKWDIKKINFGSHRVHLETQLTPEQIKSEENLNVILGSKIIFDCGGEVVQFRDDDYGYARLSFLMIRKN